MQQEVQLSKEVSRHVLRHNKRAARSGAKKHATRDLSPYICLSQINFAAHDMHYRKNGKVPFVRTAQRCQISRKLKIICFVILLLKVISVIRKRLIGCVTVTAVCVAAVCMDQRSSFVIITFKCCAPLLCSGVIKRIYHTYLTKHLLFY